MPSPNIYFLSGLGADKRAFQKLSLPQHWNIKHVVWIPQQPGETLQQYTLRLAAQIDTSQPFSLVGLSLGGIVSVELCKILRPQKAVLISSAPTRRQVPVLVRMLRYVPIHQWVPSGLFNRANVFTYWLFGAYTPGERQLINQILNDTSPQFARWAIGEIACWKNEAPPVNLFHIHGTYDKIFPIYYAHPDVRIKRGGHFMIYSHAEEISSILTQQLGE